jgi:phosphate transport system permease protein
VREAAFKATMLACLGVSVLLLAVLLYDVARDGLKVIDWQFLTSFPSSQADKAGVEAAVMGTLWLMVVCLVFIVPVGVATAVYLEEYADNTRWYNRLIEVNIQNLAAVPSIVYGILGLAFLVRGPFSLGRVVLAGGLTLGLLVLPVVIITGREAIRAVPPSIREGAMALGATQWQTIWKQVLPAAIPGVATGVILALSRAIGETAPLIVVGAATFLAFNPRRLRLRLHGAADPDLRLALRAPLEPREQLPAAGGGRHPRADGDAAAHERRGHLAAKPLRAEMVGARQWSA